MKTIANIFSILVTVYLVQCNTDCQPNNKTTDLWADTVTFDIPIVSNNTLTYSFLAYTLPTPKSYDSNSNLQFAFAMKDLSVSTSNILYFDLIVIKTYQKSLLINFIYEPNKWQKITYNYWLSLRPDIFMNIEAYTDKQFTNQGKNYQVKTSLDLKQNPTNNIVMVYLVGIRYKKQEGNNSLHQLSFSLQQQEIQNYTIQIEFSTQTTLIVESVTFSYVVYAPKDAVFASYGGVITQNHLQGAFNKNLYYLFPNYHFTAIFGLSAIQAKSSSDESITYQSTLTPYYEFAMSVQQWELLETVQVTYIILGNMPSKICQKVQACQSQQNFLIHQRQCIASCPPTSKIVHYIDGAIQCQQCPSNKHFSQITQKCECDDDYKQTSLGGCEKITLTIANPAITHSTVNNGDTLDGPPSSPKVSEKCLKLQNIQQSNKNIFVTLKASPSVSLDIRSKDSGFIKISFPDGKKASSYYCSQSSQNYTLYECLLLFAEGVPSKLFTMLFECSFESTKGKSNLCSLSVSYHSIIQAF